MIGIVAGEDVAEVTGGDGDVDLIAEGDLAQIHHVAVCGHIVDDLRQQATPVDGVRGAEHHVMLVQNRLRIGIGKDLLDRGLSVVEVAADSADIDVVALLRCHLVLLHGGYAVDRVKDDDLGMIDVLKALERRLAGIAGGRDQNDRVLAAACLLQGLGEKMRQNLQRHILEGAGGAVPKLQEIQLSAVEIDRRDRSGILRAELLDGIGAVDAVGDLLLGEIGQVLCDNTFCPVLIGHREHRFKLLFGDLREALGHK